MQHLQAIRCARPAVLSRPVPDADEPELWAIQVHDPEDIWAMSLPPLPSATVRSAFFPSATESALGQSWGMAATAVVVQRQPGGEVRLDDAVENRALGLAPVVNGQRAARFGGRGRYGGIRIGAV